MVPLARRGESDDRDLEATLQRSPTTFEPRLSHAERVCGSTDKRSAPSCNGPERCGIGAFAPRPVAPTASREAKEASKGRRLKLTVVRTSRAGHSTQFSFARCGAGVSSVVLDGARRKPHHMMRGD